MNPYSPRISKPVPQLAVLLLAGLLLAGGPARATGEFLRGDANEDGEVTWSDAWFIGHCLFQTDCRGAACWEAFDVDGDGIALVTDIIHVMAFLFDGSRSIAEPFPEPGPIPQDAADCNSYGGGEGLDDPDARLEVLDAVVPGGDDGSGFVRIALSNSRVVSGYFGRVVDSGGVIAEMPDWRDVTPLLAEFTGLDLSWVGVVKEADSIRFGAMVRFDRQIAFSPESDRVVLGFPVCVDPGTPAGDYPLVLEAGELADFATGRRIEPALASGTLTVLEDVSGDVECALERAGTVRFALADGSAAPGETASLPFRVTTDRRAQGVKFSLAFDPEVIEVVAVRPLIERPDGGPYWLAIDDLGLVPGQAGGYYLYSSPARETLYLPVDEEFAYLEVDVRVLPDATPGSTEIRFEDGAPVTDRRPEDSSEICSIDGDFCDGFDGYRNALWTGYRQVDPDTASSFVFVNGRLQIVGDISVFRGDADGDGKLAITDAVVTLDWLFRGGAELACLDAADANDDGELNISDPVSVLYYLFGGGTSSSVGRCTRDVSPDALGCHEPAVCP